MVNLSICFLFAILKFKRMRNTTLSILLLVLIGIGCQPKKPLPIDPQAELSKQLEGAVLWYQQSAEMEMSYLQSYEYAKLLLDRKLSQLADSVSPAVVLDLDETVLDNSPYEAMLIMTGITFNDKTWEEWCNLAQAEALPGAVDFLNYANEKGVEIFYISNRQVGVLGPTIENLKQLNVPHADSAHVLLKETTSDKTERRAAVTKDHEVLVYIGDNLTDFSEVYADRDEQLGKNLVRQNKEELLNNFVMLPNPMYGEWEKAILKNDWSHPDSVKLIMRKELLKAY